MKQLSKKWKIFIITIVVLIGSFYGYYKINNRNAFEEMYNSYYNFIPATALYNMPQIEPMPRDEIGLDIAELYYKDTKNDMKRYCTQKVGQNIKLFLFSVLNFKVSKFYYF